MKDFLRVTLWPRHLSLLLLCVVLLFVAGRCSPAPKALVKGANERSVYVGTYTRSEGHVDGKASGIYRMEVNLETGAISDHALVNEVVNPSFLTVSEGNDYLYAVSEMARNDEPTGFVHAYRINKDGRLREVNRLPTGGKAPCHVELDRAGRFIVVSNYVGGVAQVYAIRGDGGIEPSDTFTVSEAEKGGKDSWLHSANFSPDNKTVAICDKGLDKVWLFDFDQRTGKLTPKPIRSVRLLPGSGPRHAEWSADGRYLYVINELSNTVAVLRTATVGPMVTEQIISTLPDDYVGTSYCADLHFHPTGKFLYGSNRGHNSIAIFTVDAATGRLTANGYQPTEGEYPRNFAISPNGRFLFAANQNTSNVATLRIDPSDGSLIATNRRYDLPTPVCLRFIE